MLPQLPHSDYIATSQRQGMLHTVPKIPVLRSKVRKYLLMAGVGRKLHGSKLGETGGGFAGKLYMLPNSEDVWEKKEEELCEGVRRMGRQVEGSFCNNTCL